MTDVEIIAEALAREASADGVTLYSLHDWEIEAVAVLAALRVADRLVVNRDDLEAVLDDPVPEWIVDNAEAKGWDLSPDVAPLPRTRPPRSHRDDESLRRWEARHPSVRFRPTVPLEQECEHVWRSSFGDTFCEKCNQDAPVEIASELCRACKGSGTWADEGWSKPPQPCKACSGSGRVPAKRNPVPVQQDEPEGHDPTLDCGDCLLDVNPMDDRVYWDWCERCRARANELLADDDKAAFVVWHREKGRRYPPVPVQQDEPEGDGYTCDQCGKRGGERRQEGYPKGWFYVETPDSEFMFCCRQHLADWAVPVQQEPEDERMDTLLAEMGHERWVDAWREAADWRDQYRAGRDEVTGLLRAVVSEIDPMELTEMYAYLEADAYLATLDVLADSESNAAGGSERPVRGRSSTPAVPSVGLRDRIACELANLEYERSGRLCETEDFYADADRVLSVLHEAGTQGEREQRDEDIKVDLLRSVVAVFKETDDWDAISKLRVAMPLLMTPPSWPHDHSGAAPQSCPDCSRTVSGDREQFVLHRLFDCSAWPLSAEAGTQEDEIDV